MQLSFSPAMDCSSAQRWSEHAQLWDNPTAMTGSREAISVPKSRLQQHIAVDRVCSGIHSVLLPLRQVTSLLGAYVSLLPK